MILPYGSGVESEHAATWLAQFLPAHANLIFIHHDELSRKIFPAEFRQASVQSFFDQVFRRRMKTQPDDARSALGRVTQDVSEIGVKGDQHTARGYSGGTDNGIVRASQPLLYHGNRIIAKTSQALRVAGR